MYTLLYLKENAFPWKKKKDSMILILKVFYQEFKKFYKDTDESKIMLSYWNSGLVAKFFFEVWFLSSTIQYSKTGKTNFDFLFLAQFEHKVSLESGASISQIMGFELSQNLPSDL